MQGVERLHAFGEWDDGGVDEGTDGGIVVQRNYRVHLGRASALHSIQGDRSRI